MDRNAPATHLSVLLREILGFAPARTTHILDATLGTIADPRSLAARLTAIPGVVEHGLFIDLASVAVIAGPEGRRIVERH